MFKIEVASANFFQDQLFDLNINSSPLNNNYINISLKNYRNKYGHLEFSDIMLSVRKNTEQP